MDVIAWMIKGFFFLCLSIFFFQFDNGFSYALGTLCVWLIFKYLGINETDFWDAHKNTVGIETYELQSEAKPFGFWLGVNFICLFLIAQFMYGAELERLLDPYRIFDGYSFVTSDFPSDALVASAKTESIYSLNYRTLDAFLFAFTLAGLVGGLSLIATRWRKEHQRLVFGFRSVLAIMVIGLVSYSYQTPDIKMEISDCVTTSEEDYTSTRLKYERPGLKVDKGLFSDKIVWDDGVTEVRETKTYVNEYDITWFKQACEEPSEDNLSKCKSFSYCASAVAVNMGKNEQKEVLKHGPLVELYE